MGQQISVQVEAGVGGGGGRLSLTPTPQKQQPPPPLLARSTTNTGASGPATPPTANGIVAPAPPLGQPSPNGGGGSVGSVIDLCDSPATASTPTAGGGASSTSSMPSGRFALIEIPEDVTRSLLTCMDIPSLVKLSVCSKSMAESVYSRSYLWERIDLSTISYSRRPLLTDRSLHRLLDAVNAKEVTKALSLSHCHKIQGYGLEPLRGSVVLEELDLRVKQWLGLDVAPDGTTGLDDGFVSNLLGTMMPIARPTSSNQRSATLSRLFTVRFNSQKKPPTLDGVATARRIQDCFHSHGQVKKFLEQFDGSLKDRLWIDRVPCGRCDAALVEKIPSEQLEANDASALRCFECKAVSCGQSGCPPTKRCQRCFADLCCVGVEKCEQCRKVSCANCIETRACEGCKRTLCTDFDCGLLECGHCEKSFCCDCKPMSYCETCGDDYCPDCPVKFHECFGCCERFCSLCVPDPLSCALCLQAFCNYCDTDFLTQCDGCDKLICKECETLSDPCGGCAKSGCKGVFCSKCREFSPKFDNCCEESYCRSCLPNFDICSLCKKCPLCHGGEATVSWCSQCGESHGEKCLKVDECRDCGLTFCRYCSAADSRGGLSSCSYCHELICPSCSNRSSSPSDIFCSGCSENVQATSIGTDGSCCLGTDRQHRKSKAAGALSSQLCALKLHRTQARRRLEDVDVQRARARRRLENAEEEVRVMEEKLSIKDAGWFPSDDDVASC